MGREAESADGLPPRVRWREIGAVLSSLLFFLGGCQGNSEQVRASLAARESSWQRDLGTLKAQQSVLRERFDRVVSASSSGRTAERRARMKLDSTAQSLVDIENQLRQAGPRVEEALGRSGEQGNQVLEEETARMSGNLSGMSADLASAGRMIDDLTQSATGNDTQAD